MTRINLLPPKDLYIKHSFAEYRELPRVFNHVLKYGVEHDRIPPYYTLGHGHVLFFTNKLKYLLDRYIDLYLYLKGEMGYDLLFTPYMLIEIYKGVIWTDDQIIWQPTHKEIMVNFKRLLNKKPGYYMAKEM